MNGWSSLLASLAGRLLRRAFPDPELRYRPMSPQLDFAGRLLAIRRHTAVSVTSWGRTLRRNALVGGIDHSLHLDWLAADLVPDDPAQSQAVAELARRNGLQAVVEADHIHVELDLRGA